MELRWSNLRKRLDQFGYVQPFGLSSVSLVEKLLSDVVRITDQLKSSGIRQELSARERIPHSTDHCNHLEYSKIVKENNELHQRIIRIREDAEKEIKALKSELRKLDSDNTDLQFLNSQYLQKIQSKVGESELTLDQDQGRQPNNARGRGGRRKITTFPPKRLPPKKQQAEVRSLSPTTYSTHTSGADRLADLKAELNSLKNSLELLDDNADTLKKQVYARDLEIERLTKLIESKPPPCGCGHLPSGPTCGEHVVAHLNMELEYLQRLNQDMENRLKEALKCGHESQAKCAQLEVQCKQLQTQLSEKENLAQALQKQRLNLVTTADQEMSEAKQEFEELYSKIEILDLSLKNCNKDKLDLAGEKDALQMQLSNARVEVSKMTETVEKLQRDNHNLSERLGRVTADDGPTLEGLPKERSPETERGRGHQLNGHMVRSIERQRDIYRDQVVRLSRILEETEDSDVGTQVTSTPRRQRVAPTSASFQNEKLIRLLEGERDYYKREWQEMSRTSELNGSPLQESSEVAELTKKLLNVQDEKDELNRTMECLEKHVSETNGALQEALKDKNRLQALYEKTLASWEAQKQKFEGTSSFKSKLPLGVFELQRNYEKAIKDLDQGRTEIDDLRSRLKLATETQITERRRLEERIGELQMEVQAGSAERAELLSKVGSGKTLLDSMEEQNFALRTRMTELENALLQDKNVANKFETLSKINESSLKEAQRLLTLKVTERGDLENQVRDAENRVKQLDQFIESQKREMASLLESNKALDHERDRIQIKADDKTEKLASLQEEVHSRTREVDGNRIQISNLESRLDRLMEELLTKEGDCHDLRRKVEALNGEVQKGIHYHNVLTAQNQALEENLATLVRDNQAMDREMQFLTEERERLKRQVHDYIAEVSRVEDLLSSKEEERSEMIHQFHELSSTHLQAESRRVELESQASDSRMALVAKESELRTSQEIIAGLSEDVREHRAKQQDQELQVQNLRRDVLDMEVRLSEYQKERENLQREVFAMRELCVNLDSKKDEVSERLGSKAKEVHQLELSIMTMQQELESLRMQILVERSSSENLENLLNSQRQKEFMNELNNRELTEEVSELKERCRQTESRLEEQQELANRYRGRVGDLEIELDGIKRQLSNERFERERLNQELRKLGRQPSPVQTDRDNARQLPPSTSPTSRLPRTFTSERGSRHAVEYATVYTTNTLVEQRSAPTVTVTPPNATQTDNARRPAKPDANHFHSAYR